MKHCSSKIVAGIAAGALLLMAAAMNVNAQSADALLDKLVEKGILTVKEANELKEQTDTDFTKAYAAKTGLPEWVTSMRFNGDLRLRYDRTTAEDPAFVDRDRFRYRLRFGFTATLKDDFEIGIGLTSTEKIGQNGDAADPISNNQTFLDNGSKKAVGFDKVYVKWTPVNNSQWAASSIAGKFENPFVFPSTMLFDRDYTPEGFAQEFTWNVNNNHKVKGVGAAFILDEVASSTKDPYLFAGQVQWDAMWSPKWQTAMGVAYFSIANEGQLTNLAIPNIANGNTRIGPTGTLANGFSTLYAYANLIYNFEKVPLYNGPFPVMLGADLLNNFAASEDGNGYSFGVTFGKAGKKGLWEITYRYTHLEADAWFEEVVESDFGANYKYAPPGAGAGTTATGYRSGTNIRGNWFKGTYNVFDSLSFSVAYFLTDLLNEPPPGGYNSGTSRLFVEAVWKY